MLAGHDRGGRCTDRLVLDWPERVERLAVLDIVPTADMWRCADKEFGLIDWHWFFLAQPEPFPEELISAAPDTYYFRGDRSRFHPEALADPSSAASTRTEARRRKQEAPKGRTRPAPWYSDFGRLSPRALDHRA